MAYYVSRECGSCLSSCFFNDTATTEIYTLSLHDALPISTWQVTALSGSLAPGRYYLVQQASGGTAGAALPAPDASGSIRSEEHTSELHSRQYLVCRLLLEQKTIRYD